MEGGMEGAMEGRLGWLNLSGGLRCIDVSTMYKS